MSTGVVRSFERSFGWITDDADGQDCFVYWRNIDMNANEFKIVYPQDVVFFERVESAKGPRAKNVRVI